MIVPFYDLKAAHEPLKERLTAGLARAIDRSHLIMGPELDQFEADFAAYCGAQHCVGVGNGLDALKIILQTVGIGPGDEVIVPAHTFIATWLAVTELGAIPVPIDVDPATFNLDTTLIESKISSRTKAIMPVHLYGRLSPMEEIWRIANAHGLKIVEDAAQAHGAAMSDGRRSGVLGAAAGFSFYPTKNLGALGDAGAIVTNDEVIDRQARLLRNYGSARKYEHEICGMNSRLDEIQAAFLGIKLPGLDKANALRARHASRYLAGLEGCAAITLPIPAGTNCVWHQFTIQSLQRDALRAYLDDKGVHTLIHYPQPPHLQPAMAHLGWSMGDFPVAERISRQVLSLPLWPEMEEAQIDYVIHCIQTWKGEGHTNA